MFFVVGSILSWNMCKLRHKLRNAPLRSKFKIFFEHSFQIILTIFLFFTLCFQIHILLVYLFKTNWCYTLLKAYNEKQKIWIEVINICPELQLATLLWTPIYKYKNRQEVTIPVNFCSWNYKQKNCCLEERLNVRSISL